MGGHWCVRETLNRRSGRRVTSRAGIPPPLSPLGTVTSRAAGRSWPELVAYRSDRPLYR